MLRILRSKKAQNTLEYALLFAIVIGAVSAMQLYLRRGLNARIRGGSDILPTTVLGQAGGDAIGVLGNHTQYEPYYIREGEYGISSTTNQGTEKGAVGNTGGQRQLSGATSTRTGRQGMTGAKEDLY